VCSVPPSYPAQYDLGITWRINTGGLMGGRVSIPINHKNRPRTNARSTIVKRNGPLNHRRGRADFRLDGPVVAVARFDNTRRVRRELFDKYGVFVLRNVANYSGRCRVRSTAKHARFSRSLPVRLPPRSSDDPFVIRPRSLSPGRGLKPGNRQPEAETGWIRRNSLVPEISRMTNLTSPE